MTLAAGLADVHVAVVDVADLADARRAVHADVADLTGGQANLSELAFLRQQLCSDAGGADKLSAVAGLQLDVVDDGADGDVGKRQAVARLDIRSGGGEDGVAGLQADRCEHIAQLAVLVLDQRDERAAVRIVLQALHDSGHIQLIATEVDHAVLALVAAAAMADGDSAVAVATGILLQGLKQATLGLCLLIDAVESRHGHAAAGRGIRLIRFNRHFALHSFMRWIRPYPRRTRWSWNRRSA